jgi:hypothetical protein
MAHRTTSIVIQECDEKRITWLQKALHSEHGDLSFSQMVRLALRALEAKLRGK